MTRRLGILVGFGLAALVAVAALVVATTGQHQHAHRHVAQRSGMIGGPFTLVAAGGKAVMDQTYRGKWLLIYFGYTSCPDACPTALNDMSVALETLGSVSSKVQPLFITVDPKRDTPKIMADYLKSFDARIVGLTGTQEQIDSVTKAYRVYVAPQKSEGADYLVDHSGNFYVMGPQGQFVDVIAGDEPGDQMAGKLRELMASFGS
jgi:protein SCO1/2